MKRFISLLCFLILSLSVIVEAHPGKTDSSGGHYNRKTGGYHSHNGGGSSGGSGYSRPTQSPNYGQHQDVVDIYKVQVRLNELGYHCGTPDGIKGAQTIGAIKNFQSDKGLASNGVVGHQTRIAFGL